MSWRIAHRSLLIPALPTAYWTGEPFGSRAVVYSHDPNQAALFRTKKAAAEAWWGTSVTPFGPTCCKPEETA